LSTIHHDNINNNDSNESDTTTKEAKPQTTKQDTFSALIWDDMTRKSVCNRKWNCFENRN